MSASEITLVVDGIEVGASNGEMLVDAAKGGDVEIPVFCYEPKLGEPVGACRMCLVEVEGIPKLQTACSTPVRDGMVVYTQTDRVKEAQNAVVEFLLVNHPLDCPVCDKGGECPLQDISMGWGPGRSRFSDPKRHFQKPIPLSPLVRIDRERCILCYRCVRFSQEVAEDEQLQLIERGAASYVGTFDDRPYIAPFHGNVIELCPVGALTSEAYRFRARPWDIEDAGSVCTLCPSQCNVKFTVRDEQVQRVLARDNADVDDGWLCDKGRFGFQMMSDPDRITEPMVRRAGNLEPASWEDALEAAANGLRAAGEPSAAIVGGGASNEEGYLVQRIMRGALGSGNVDSRSGGGPPRELAAALSEPGISAPISAIDDADAVLVIGCDPMHSMPILDLRLRKAARRNSVRLAIASERPTSLDGGSEESVRYAPGDAAAFLKALAAQLGDDQAPEPYGEQAEQAASSLRPGKTVILYGERIGQGPAGAEAMAALLECTTALRLSEDAAGLFEVPEAANARGLREAGCIPGSGPGFAEAPEGMDTTTIRDAAAGDQLKGMVLFESNPVRDFPGGPAWKEALARTDFIVAFSMFDDESTAQADVVFPAESHAEKEGTVTHPDGRLQRVRPNIPNPANARPPWQVLAELSTRLGDETGIASAEEALETLANEVPFYAGLTPEEIGGHGIRWQDREEATNFPKDAGGGATSPEPNQTRPGGNGAEIPTSIQGSGEGAPPAASSNGALKLGTYRDLWSGEVTERNPALRFLAPKQTIELAPTDAERLGVSQGDEVDVRSNGTSLRAKVMIRERMRPGAAFMIEGTAEQNATALTGAESVEVTKAGDAE